MDAIVFRQRERERKVNVERLWSSVECGGMRWNVPAVVVNSCCYNMNKWSDLQRISSLRQLMKENSVADSWFETRYKDSLPKTMEEFEKYLLADLGYPDEKEQKFKKMIDRTQEIGESRQDFYYHKLALIDDYGGIDDSFKAFLINNGLDSEYRDSLTLSCDSLDELLKILKKRERAKQMAPQSVYPNLMGIGQPAQESDQPSMASQFMNLTNQDHNQNQNGQFGYGRQYVTNYQNARPRTYASRAFEACTAETFLLRQQPNVVNCYFSYFDQIQVRLIATNTFWRLLMLSTYFLITRRTKLGGKLLILE